MTKDPELCRLAANIARALEWKHQGTEVYDPVDGLTFYLNWSRPQPGKPRQLHLRASISGPPTLDPADRKRYLDVKYSGDHVPEMNVSAEKGPERMAREIKRRLIPSASELWKTLKERADERADYEAESQKARDAILGCLPAASLIGPAQGTVYLNTSYPDRIYAEMTPHGDSVSFNRLTLPAKLAVQFAELIRHYLEGRTNGSAADPFT